MTTQSTVHSDFAWQAHPARERPRHAAAALVVIGLLGGASALLGGSPWWGVTAIVVLLAALNRFFFPTRFTLDDEGITAQHPLRTVRMEWGRIRRFVHDAHGGHLSVRARRSRLDAFGGIHLLFGARRDEAIERIAASIERAKSDDRR